ncbi:hypothetical protein C2869_18425 [Saccharobesus litoralis]|uniref:Anti-sigma factor n=1 Tax=Saccharobesus litoralis TaxID=2172099 RepID=A0A2S0VVM0_9ALTE|nr:hypothetical protein [Saccharobesus litoralis]AWB68267.1 hypothetical protein C2869_18425 [Saccharobesus litoralis]
MNKQFEINDEVLSAFLDAELPEEQMQQVRDRLAEDDELAMRLADLSMVDELIVEQYNKINQRPLSSGVQALLDQAETNQQEQSSNNVVQLSLWQKAQRQLKQPMAIAASVALVAGIGLANVMMPAQTSQWAQVEQLLHKQLSGEQVALNNGDSFVAKLSFINHQGDYCRQYDLQTQVLEQHIACHINQKWQLMSSAYQTQQAGQVYQTATSSNVIRQQIEQMASGEFLDKQDEKQAIEQLWQDNH